MGKTGKKGKQKVKKEPEDTDTSEDEDEDFWTDDLVEDEDEELEELDPKKLKYTKIKDLKVGMEDVHVEATIDFVGDIMGKEYGDEPFALGFLKDDTGEVKITFWGEACKKAKKGMEVRVLQGSVTEFRGQTQLNPHRKRGIEFL